MNLSKRKEGLVVIKVYLENVSDKVDWDFLLSMLTNIEFPIMYVNWIRLCISLHFYIKPRRGIKQGCHLSPYLFVFVVEFLSLRLESLREQNLLSGIQLGRQGEWITHLCYADDIFLFNSGSLIQLQVLKHSISFLCEATGQSINLSKSNIIFNNSLPSDKREQISQLLLMDQMILSQKYLGNPILFMRPSWNDYVFLVDRIQSKLQGWKTKLLSHAGREILIKSTLSSIPSNFMSTVKLPKGIIKKINSIICDFWWGFDNASKHLYLKSWASFQFPKIYGGLGIRNLDFMNWSLVMKHS